MTFDPAKTPHLGLAAQALVSEGHYLASRIANLDTDQQVVVLNEVRAALDLELFTPATDPTDET